MERKNVCVVSSLSSGNEGYHVKHDIEKISKQVIQRLVKKDKRANVGDVCGDVALAIVWDNPIPYTTPNGMIQDIDGIIFSYSTYTYVVIAMHETLSHLRYIPQVDKRMKMIEPALLKIGVHC